MASPSRWTWIWVSFRSWWWTGKPGMLQSMALQRVGHDWVMELNWEHPVFKDIPFVSAFGAPNKMLKKPGGKPKYANCEDCKMRWLILCLSLVKLRDAQMADKTLFPSALSHCFWNWLTSELRDRVKKIHSH